MKVQTIDSQVWWIAHADEIRPVEGLDTATFFTEIAKALEFKDPPKPGQNNVGAEFLNGFLRRDKEVISVPKLVIYNDGINVVVQGRSSGAEKALQIVLELAFSLGVRKPTTTPAHHYLSTIVVDFEKSLDLLVPQAFLKKISASAFRENAQFLSIAFNADKTEVTGPFPALNPTSFSIGRRLEVPYDLNRYFSQAAMTTEAHLSLLEDLEGLI
jgi:hypothetical protein